MQEDNHSSRWQSFLASRIQGLEELRLKIFQLGEGQGSPIWVAEHADNGEPATMTLDQIQVSCLRWVRSCPRFICVIDGTYGTTWNAADISILEMEIFTAALTQREILIIFFNTATFESFDRRLRSLMTLLVRISPRSVLRMASTQEEVLNIVAKVTDPINRSMVNPIVTDFFPQFVEGLAINRMSPMEIRLNNLGIQFLDSEFAPISHRRPEKDLVDHYIKLARSESNMPERLARLWVAIRHISGAPFLEARFEEYLPLWEEVLTEWAYASGWYSLHGHLALGRLAALNSLLMIRTRMSEETKRKLGSPSIFANRGAVASEYYSISKRVRSSSLRGQLLEIAMTNVNSELGDPLTADMTGLVAIRGAINLAQGRITRALEDYRFALDTRVHNQEDIGRIGESEMQLGAAYLRSGMLADAQPLLTAGVEKLESAGRFTFAVLGLRALGDYFTAMQSGDRAMEAYLRAIELARKYELPSSVPDLESALDVLAQRKVT